MIWNTDQDITENGQVDLVKGFEKYNIPLTDKFKEVVERYVGENLLGLGESLGFKFYQPVEKYDESFRFSLSALYEDKVILIILNDPNASEKKDGFESTMQIDFARLQDWVAYLKDADEKGVLERGEEFIVPEETYTAQNETLSGNTLKFIKASLELLNGVDERILVKGHASNPKRFSLFTQLFQKHLGDRKNFYLE